MKLLVILFLIKKKCFAHAKTVVHLHSSPKTTPWIMSDQKLSKILNFGVFVLMLVFCSFTLLFHNFLIFVINFVIYVAL